MEGLSSTVKISFLLLPNFFLTPQQLQMQSRFRVHQGDIGSVNIPVQSKAECVKKMGDGVHHLSYNSFLLLLF